MGDKKKQIPYKLIFFVILLIILAVVGVLAWPDIKTALAVLGAVGASLFTGWLLTKLFAFGGILAGVFGVLSGKNPKVAEEIGDSVQNQAETNPDLTGEDIADNFETNTGTTIEKFADTVNSYIENNPGKDVTITFGANKTSTTISVGSDGSVEDGAIESLTDDIFESGVGTVTWDVDDAGGG